MLSFEHGQKYTRPEIKEQAGLSRNAKGGIWDTGVVEYESEFLIFANVGTPGSTGHDYGNCWEGKYFLWYHKSGSHLGWPSVQRLLEKGRTIHIFWRTVNVAPFEYAGTARPLKVKDKDHDSPVEILWSFEDADI